MLVVVDTNILVSAIKTKLDINSPTKPQRLFLDIISGKHTMVISTPIIREYEDVLKRDYLKHYPIHELRTSLDEIYP